MILRKFYHHPDSLLLRKILFQVHLWIGVGLGLYVLVVCTTGASLVFRAQIQHALYPEFFPGATAGPATDLVDVAEKMKAAFPNFQLVGVGVPNEEQHTFVGYLYKDEKYRAVFADAKTGAVIGAFPEQSFILWLQNLHFYLLAGTTGLFLNGLGAISLLALALSGLFVWWPGIASWRRSLKLDFRKNWKRVNWDLHNAVGFWTAAVVLMWAVTGAYFAFPQQFRSLVSTFSNVRSYPLVSSRPAAADAKPADLRELVNKAKENMPAGQVARLSLPTNTRGAVQVVLTRTKPAVRENEDYVYFYFDQFTGDLIQRYDLAGLTTGDHAISWLGRLHVGSFGGTPVRIMWLLLGLGPAVLFVTGTIMWWNRVVVPPMREALRKEEVSNVYRLER